MKVILTKASQDFQIAFSLSFIPSHGKPCLLLL